MFSERIFMRAAAMLTFSNLVVLSVNAGRDISALYLEWDRTASQSGIFQRETSLAEPWDNGSSIHDICKSFFLEYGKQAGDFVECSIDNARPFTFCEHCVVHYIKTISVYEDLKKNDETRENCKTLLLDSDRVQVINNVHYDIQHIWTSANCEDCFQDGTLFEYPNGTVSYELKATTLDFLELYYNFTSCIPTSNKTLTANDTVCEICRTQYQKMNDMYNSLTDPDTPKRICMDIVDMMNYTRLLWGKTLECTKVFPDATPIIIIAIFICMMPVSFYISMKVYGTRREKIFMTQKRMSYHDSQSRRAAYTDGSVSQLLAESDSGEHNKAS